MADVAGALTQPQAELRMRSMVGDAGFAVARPRSPKPHQRFAIGILSDGCWKEFCFGESFEGAFAKWNAGIRFDHNAAQTHREIELPNIVGGTGIGPIRYPMRCCPDTAAHTVGCTCGQ